MKTTKGKRQKGPDTDKAIARSGVQSSKDKKNKVLPNISLDTVLAEKDEVKLAEEKLRQKINKTK